MRIALLLALVSLASAPLAAKVPYVKKAKAAGIEQIKDCKSCHTAKTPSATDLNEVGKWLMEQKAAKKAADCDMAWLKEYYAKKK